MMKRYHDYVKSYDCQFYAWEDTVMVMYVRRVCVSACVVCVCRMVGGSGVLGWMGLLVSCCN